MITQLKTIGPGLAVNFFQRFIINDGKNNITIALVSAIHQIAVITHSSQTLHLL